MITSFLLLYDILMSFIGCPKMKYKCDTSYKIEVQTHHIHFMGGLKLHQLHPEPSSITIKLNSKIPSDFSNTSVLFFDSLWSLWAEENFKYICKGISEGLLQKVQKGNLESFDNNSVKTSTA